MTTAPLEVLAMAEAGGRIFPLAVLSKLPPAGFTDWQKDHNSSDADEINAWAREYPKCNWAMLCGTPSDRVVLDYDCKNGNHGLDQLNSWINEHGSDWLQTQSIKTPSGGLHQHFALGSLHVGKDNDGKLGSGVDVQGAGSYVVLPPSRLKDGIYEFQPGNGLDCPLLLVPDWMAPGLEKIVPAAHLVPAVTQETASGKIPSGQQRRHKALIRRAGKLIHAGISEAALLADLSYFNQTQFQEPWPEAEIRRQAQDLFRRYPRVAVPELILGRSPEECEQDLEGKLVTIETSLRQGQEKTEYLLERLIPAGTTMALAAQVKTGKTTLLFDIIRSLITGEPWNDFSARRTDVIYLTEQGRTSFNEQARRAGLDGGHLHVLYYNECLKYSWGAVANTVVKMAAKLQAKLIVVDTFLQWARPKNGGNDDQSAQAMDTITLAVESGVTVIFVFHSGKNNECDIWNAIAGTRAFAGKVEGILHLKRPRGNDRNLNHRILNYLGRLEDIPEHIALELVGDRYVVRGEGSAIELHKAVQEIERHLPTSPDQAETLASLMALAGGISRATAQRAIARLGASRVDGNRRAPDRFFLDTKHPVAQACNIKKSILGNWVGIPTTPCPVDRTIGNNSVLNQRDERQKQEQKPAPAILLGQENPPAPENILSNDLGQLKTDPKSDDSGSWKRVVGDDQL